jgi:hypothetical protein
LITCNVVIPQLFWVKSWRRNLMFTFFMSLGRDHVGMWFERFVIIVTLPCTAITCPAAGACSIRRGWMPGIFVGTIGIFFTLYLLFARYFPVLAFNELKSILKSSGESYKNGRGATPITALSDGRQSDLRGLRGPRAIEGRRAQADHSWCAGEGRVQSVPHPRHRPDHRAEAHAHGDRVVHVRDAWACAWPCWACGT